jgi:hypothetical protein
MARPTTRGVASKPLAELVKNRLVANSETLDYEVLAYFCDKTPGTVESWLKSGRFGGGTALRLWHLMETAGIKSPELAKVRRETPHGEYVARLVVFGVIDIETAREIGGNVNDEAVYAAMRGERAFFRPNLDLAQLRELYDEDLQSKVTLLKSWLEDGLPDELKAQIKKGKPVPKPQTQTQEAAITATHADNHEAAAPASEPIPVDPESPAAPSVTSGATYDPTGSWSSTEPIQAATEELDKTDDAPAPAEQPRPTNLAPELVDTPERYDLSAIVDMLIGRLGLDRDTLVEALVKELSPKVSLPESQPPAAIAPDMSDKIYELAQLFRETLVGANLAIHMLTDEQRELLRKLVGERGMYDLKMAFQALSGSRAMAMTLEGK